jgi:hypothetical protein
VITRAGVLQTLFAVSVLAFCAGWFWACIEMVATDREFASWPPAILVVVGLVSAVPTGALAVWATGRRI